MDEKELIQLSNKLLNRFIFKSKQFCDKYCVPDGLGDILKVYSLTGNIYDELKFSNKLGYDYDYFAFVKSTKTLIALKALQNDTEYHFNEDCFMLIRSIFENHIINRYVREHIDIENERQNVVQKFILNPLAVTFNHFSLSGSGIIDDKGKTIGKIPVPASYKMGEEDNYYSNFYQFLCQYTHCSFGALTCYFDDRLYTYKKNNYKLLTLFFSIFVFTKIYEGVVTVEGEDFDTEKEEKSFYNLAYDSIELQIRLIDYLIDFYNNVEKDQVTYILEKYLGDDDYNKSNIKIVEMLRQMKKSIFDDPIGSLDKSKMIDPGHFDRKYPTAWSR